MAYASGLSGSFGFKKETTYGVPVTVNKWMPILSESLNVKRNRLESQAIIAGTSILGSGQWSPGTIEVTGGIQCELTDQSFGPLLENAIGAVSTGAPSGGYYPHTITPGVLPSMTAQVGRPDDDGTVYPWTYSGLVCSSWSLGAKANELATWGQDWVGYMGWVDSRTFADCVTTNTDTTITSAAGAAFTQADRYKPISGTGIPTGAYIASVTSATSIEISAAATASATVTGTIGTALTTVSYATDIAAISCVGGTVTVGGTSVEFEECSFSGENGLSGPRPTLSDPRSRKGVPISERMYTASISSDYISNAMHNQFMAGTEAAIVLTLADTAGCSYVLTGNMRVDDQAVNIAGKDILKDTLTGKMVRSGSADSTALTVVWTSTDATI